MTYQAPEYPCADCGRRVSEDSGEVMEGGFCEDCAPHHEHDIEVVSSSVRARYQNLREAA